MVILTLGIFVASSLFVIGEQRDDEKQQALAMAHFLVDQTSRLGLWDRQPELTAFFNQVNQFHFTFHHVIVEHNGAIVFHTVLKDHPDQVLSAHAKVSEAGTVEIVDGADGTEVYDAAVAVPAQNAVVHVGVVRGPIGEHTAATLKSIAAGSSLALLLGIGLSWMLAVLTTRKVATAESALRASEERFRLLFEQAPDSIMMMDLSGGPPPIIVAANQATCRMHGYDLEEIVGHPITKLDMPEDQDKVEERVERILKGHSVVFEAEHRRKDGTQFPVEVIARLAEFDGKPAILAIDRDISDRKRAEEEKHSLEAQLLQAQKMQAIGRLAGGIAHDINNVLGTVMGSVSLLQDEIDRGHPHRENLDRIDLACQRGRDVTRNFLGYARKGTFVKRVFDPNRLLEETTTLLEATIPKKISITTDVDPDLMSVNGDRSLIGQALMNVCINAVDAMEGEGTLRINSRNYETDDRRTPLHAELEPGRYVRLTVQDTGTGMDEETLERVFEPFFTTKPRGKGTGLGLSMVHGTTLSHGGAVSVESLPGQGTSIHLFFPATTGEPETEAGPGASPEGPTKGAGRILVVEDEPLLRRVARQMLERLGYDVLEADNGARGVEMFKEHRHEVALVLLDLVMPEMDGAEAFSVLREIDPDATVLISSGFTDDEVVEELLEAGAVGFVEKPYNLKSLGDAVARALGGKRARDLEAP